MNGKLLIFTSLVLFSTCRKKSGDIPPADAFDPTHYYVTGTTTMQYTTNFCLLFTTSGKADYLAAGGSMQQRLNYTYLEGKLRVGSDIFTITGNHINGVSPGAAYNTATLQKIPDENAFSGTVFRGTLTQNGKNSYVSTFYFDGQKFGHNTLADKIPAVEFDYRLSNNGVATASLNNGEIKFLFIITDGKLSVSVIQEGQSLHYGILNALN